MSDGRLKGWGTNSDRVMFSRPPRPWCEFRAHSQASLPDIGVGSLYTRNEAEGGVRGAADAICRLELAWLELTAVWAPHNYSQTSHNPDIRFNTNVQC